MTAFRYRPEVDGLRAVAVLLVVLYHAKIGVAGGFIGVDVFFVISGFLITGLILRSRVEGRFSLATFWERRLRRIFPAAAVMSAVTVAFGAVIMMPEALDQLARSAVAQQLMVSNVFFWGGTGYFDGASELKPLLHTWSLAVEEQFYLFYPFLLLLLTKSGVPAGRVLPVTLGALLLASFGLSAWGVTAHPEGTFFLLPTRMWEMLLGAMLVFAPTPSRIPRALLEALSWLGLAGIAWPSLYYDGATVFPGPAAIPPCLGAALIIYSNLGQPTRLGQLLSHRSAVFVGLLSYSLYLWHWPVLAFCHYWFGAYPPLGPRLFAILLSFFLGWVSWRFVETPMRQPRPWSVGRFAFLSAGALTAVIVGTGSLIATAQGFPNRFDEEVIDIGAVELPNGHRLLPEDALLGELAAVGPAGSPGEQRGPQFVFWGDSHLIALTETIDRHALESGVHGAVAAHPGFPPLLDAWCVGRDPKPIVDWNRAIRTSLKTKKVPNVILVARWSLYVELPEWGGNQQLLVDSFSERTGDSHAVDAMARSLTRTVKDLTTDGVEVWILKQVPLQPFDPPRKLQLSKVLGQAPPDGVTLEETEARHARANSIIDALGAQEHVHILDPLPYCFDSEGHSILTEEGRSLYFDDNHLSKLGADKFFEPLLDELFLRLKH